MRQPRLLVELHLHPVRTGPAQQLPAVGGEHVPGAGEHRQRRQPRERAVQGAHPRIVGGQGARVQPARLQQPRPRLHRVGGLDGRLVRVAHGEVQPGRYQYDPRRLRPRTVAQPLGGGQRHPGSRRVPDEHGTAGSAARDQPAEQVRGHRNRPVRGPARGQYVRRYDDARLRLGDQGPDQRPVRPDQLVDVPAAVHVQHLGRGLDPARRRVVHRPGTDEGAGDLGDPAQRARRQVRRRPAGRLGHPRAYRLGTREPSSPTRRDQRDRQRSAAQTRHAPHLPIPCPGRGPLPRPQPFTGGA